MAGERKSARQPRAWSSNLSFGSRQGSCMVTTGNFATKLSTTCRIFLLTRLRKVCGMTRKRFSKRSTDS
jgi:hypothetical protein